MLPQLPKRYTCIGFGLLIGFIITLYFRLSVSLFDNPPNHTPHTGNDAVKNVNNNNKQGSQSDDAGVVAAGAVCATATVTLVETLTKTVHGHGSSFGTSAPDGDDYYGREKSKWYDPMRNAAKYEDLEKLLSPDQKLLVKETAKKYATRESNADKRIQKLYKLDTSKQWLDFVMELDEDGMPPLTKFAQDYIWKHQNPPDCTKAKFLVMEKYPNDEAFGLGAILQAISENLNVALRTGYILLYNTTEAPGEHFIEKPELESHPCKRSLDCVFQPLSLCSNDFVTEENSITLPSMNPIPLEFVETPVWSVPPVFGQTLRELYPDITVDALKYWWRLQALAYLSRPNGETMSRLRALRTDKTLNIGITGSTKGNTVEDGIPLPFPMPRGAFSMHVRHGDKNKEMRLIPFSEYVQKAERFIAENPLAYRKVGFISSEDPEVLREAQQITRSAKEMVGKEASYVDKTTFNQGWTWYWSDIPRINGGPEDQLKVFGNRTDMTIRWLLQLVTAIECDGMIGTRASNWNRLIDSLRCIWLAKCKQPYIEVGDAIDWSFYSG